MKHATRNVEGRQAGGGIILVLILTAVFGVVVFELQRRSENDSTSIKIERIKTARDALHQRLNGVAATSEALYASFRAPAVAAANAELVRCLTANAGCSARGAQRARPFALVAPEGAKVAGTPADPVLYDARGQRCAAGANCVYQAVGFFYTRCRAGLATCSLAETLHTLIQIKYIPTGELQKDLPKLADLPTDAARASGMARLANRLSVDAILSLLLACPRGSLATKDQAGVMRCTCIGQQTGVDARGKITCTQAERCRDGEVFLGVDANGKPECLKEITCRPAQRTSFMMTCRDTGCRQTSTLQVTCPRGADGLPGRLRELRRVEGPSRCTGNNDPNKKAGAVGVQQCEVFVQFQCCG